MPDDHLTGTKGENGTEKVATDTNAATVFYFACPAQFDDFKSIKQTLIEIPQMLYFLQFAIFYPNIFKKNKGGVDHSRLVTDRLRRFVS